MLVNSLTAIALNDMQGRREAINIGGGGRGGGGSPCIDQHFLGF